MIQSPIEKLIEDVLASLEKSTPVADLYDDAKFAAIAMNSSETLALALREAIEAIKKHKERCYPGNYYATNKKTGEVLTGEYMGNPCDLCETLERINSLTKK